MYNLLTYLKYPQLLNVRNLTPNIVRCLTPNIVLPISLVWLLATQIRNPFCKRSHSYQLVLDIFSTDFKKHMPLARTPQIIYKKRRHDLETIYFQDDPCKKKSTKNQPTNYSLTWKYCKLPCSVSIHCEPAELLKKLCRMTSYLRRGGQPNIYWRSFELIEWIYQTTLSFLCMYHWWMVKL